MDTKRHLACILMGSNIEPEVNILKAISLLSEEVNILQVSSIWQSASADCCYPDYLNMAVMVTTPLEAEQLKETILRPLEAKMGRVRTEDKNASRTIDFDIILFDGNLLDPGLWQYVHRAVPVAELFPNYLSAEDESLSLVAGRLAAYTPILLRSDLTIQLPERS